MHAHSNSIHQVDYFMHDSRTEAVERGQWVFYLSKLISAGLDGDQRKVVAYTRRIADRIRKDGDDRSASQLEAIASSLGQSRNLGAARHNRKVPIPVDAEARIPVADESSFSVDDISVILPDDAEAMIERLLGYISHADRLAERGVGVTPSMLLYGPPGCGKTEVAKFISARLGLPLITGRVDALISSYLGSTSKNLRSLFDYARSRPCVLFLDELDALGKMRDDDRELGELKRVVISLLQNIDVLGEDHVLLAATNHEHLLDPALWRRFAFHVPIKKPSSAGREQLLKLFLGDEAVQQDVELLAAVTEGFSGAELKGIAQNAIRDAILAGRDEIDVADILPLIFRRNAEANGALLDRDAMISLIHTTNSRISQKRIAAIFNVSHATVSRVLKGG